MILDEAAWRARAAAHEARVDALVAPHLERRSTHVKHPVHDFLFTYYAHRPAQLRRWHPGFGVRLADAPEYDGLRGYDAGAVAASYVEAQRPLLTALHRLLRATAARPAHTGCFGLHEWAMVYRLGADGQDPRHADWPLRLGGSGTDAVVESHRIACSHFDAFRFFTPPARPLNTLSPGSEDRDTFEQPGCLHAGMDLYKHAFRLSPMICSELVMDAFELAWDIRVLDMRAAPYDFTGVVLDHTGEPWTPVEIETPKGKQEYAAAQRAFAQRGQVVRQCLIEDCARLLDVRSNANMRPTGAS
ncbi:3-methyladenine DNA glycosylase [Nocardioides plantarum]|uniref:3-methyladenine DNA glycosylase n=1 Tax=Nocardioides plantarum TaxID=29299 RepID=A0ABV5KDF0_9ACTN|nr:3-methyladenine DNA glycosylase [Nocardioides plantarum]